MSGSSARHGFRNDIEGVRALAILLVMFGHAGVPFMPGGFVGVDVFFVISGFLINGLLVAELERTGRISLLGFYARRAKRLLPAAAVVLATTLVLTYFFLPPNRWRGVGWDVVASGLYAMNWRMAAQSVDYLANDDAPSILQHFWSLAVEEQFYLIWPLLLLIVATLAAITKYRIGDLRSRLFYIGGLSVIGVPSLIWSIHLTTADPSRAYFVTTTRLWELALGAVVAMLIPDLRRLPRAVAAIAGWLGLVAVAVSAAVISPAVPFPGYAALLPTLGTAAIIAGGVAAGRAGPAVILGLRPVRSVGAVSYSLYLWHWPLLIVADATFGPLTAMQGLGVMVLAVVPAVVTYRYVENPVRRNGGLAARPMLAIRLGLACTALPVLAAFGFQAGLVPALAAPGVPAGPGANAIADTASQPIPDHVDSISPDPAVARDDVSAVYADRCVTGGVSSELKTCVYGNPQGTFTVALVGDSHAAQWFPAVDAVAGARGWKLVTFIKSSCPMISADIIFRDIIFPSCSEWNRKLQAALTGAQRPDLLIVTSAATYNIIRDGEVMTGRENDRATESALRQAWGAVAAAGPTVVVVRDTPRPYIDIPECVAQHRNKLSECGFSRKDANAASLIQVRAAMDLTGVHLIDVNNSICPGDPCSPVIGNILVYRDSNHMTASYARTLTDRLSKALEEILGVTSAG